ncbi:MAG: hypothetical protein WBF17_05620 [Phycisphaerae bacterium]
MRGLMIRALCGLAVTGCFLCLAAGEDRKQERQMFVRVSTRDSRYFELSDGRPYVPIGLNVIQPADGGMEDMKRWLGKLAANRGNYCRIWLSSPFFDVEHARSGEYDADRAKRIDELLALARKHGIRLKLCLEHFRRLTGGSRPWITKPLHHVSQGGPAKDIAEFLDSPRCREQFKRKLAWYVGRYGSDPTVFGWELWNEMNCVHAGDWMKWTEIMLEELHRLFPKNLAMQSLGSFDHERKRTFYRSICVMKGNDVAQVHRYLDLGASLKVCHGPADVLAADAVRELRAFDCGRPILLAESGAVEKSHSGPFKLYQKDTDGIILHDVLFAPFFAGAAGPGHIWHWGVYVDRMNLWHHFDRFAEAIDGLDPPAEGFEPIELAHDRLRILALKGKRTFLAWCRDSENTWTAELGEGKAPQRVRGAAIDLSKHADWLAGGAARAYDPWANRWSKAQVEGGRIVLPEFSRSIVVRIGRPGRDRKVGQPDA